MKCKVRTAVLISGRGSNMRSLVEVAKAEDFPAAIDLVLSNRPDAAGLDYARSQGIAAIAIDHKSFADRSAFETALQSCLERYGIELICLAGFMRLLTPAFTEHWQGRIINIHPALLPAFKGLNTHARALAEGASIHGCTVHHVTSGMDEGPIIAQVSVPVLPDDTADTLAARVLTEEHRIYPPAIAQIATQIGSQPPLIAPRLALKTFGQIAMGVNDSIRLSISLTQTPRALIMARDADVPDRSPLISAIAAEGYPWQMAINRKHTTHVKQLTFYTNLAAEIDFKTERRTVWLRLGEKWRRLISGLPGILRSGPMKRHIRYAKWCARYHRLSWSDVSYIRTLAKQQRLTERIHIWALTPQAAAHWATTRRKSPLPLAECRLLTEAKGPFAPQDIHLVVESGVLIDRYAPLLLALWLSAHMEAAMVFGDNEAPDSTGLLAPRFFGRFDPYIWQDARNQPVLGIAALSNEALLRCQSVQSLAEAALLVFASGRRPSHIPTITASVPMWKPSSPATVPAAKINRVSFIIPSRDNPVMLKRTVETLARTTKGYDVEFIVVDHASWKLETTQTLQWLRDTHPVRIVRAEGDFNFSRLMNMGRAQACGDYLFSVNDDIEAIEDNWLDPLYHLLEQEETGCVGPCLLFPDRRIQHAGVVTGFGGLADHIGRLRNWSDPDLPWILTHMRQVTAVTGAVLGVRSQIWDRIGGWNEALSVEFNDIEFCLKIQALGLRNIYCPQSVLVHHESVSRGKPEKSRQWKRMQRDRNLFIRNNWPDLIYDPFFSANWSLRHTKVALAIPPRRPPLRQLHEYPGD